MAAQLRQRKRKQQRNSNIKEDNNLSGEDKSNSELDASSESEANLENDEQQETTQTILRFASHLSLVVGITAAVIIAYQYVVYIWTLHENRLWFTNIEEVEREISFRTESGLYYSYYKQMVNAKSFQQGLYELTHDNTTENWRTINVLQRMNIYQEVILSILYKTFNLKNWIEPVFFYIDSVFAIHGMHVMALYCTAWTLTNSWLAGLLASAFYIFNKEDTTRVEFTVPLRESFSIPFLFLQIAFITCYLKQRLSLTKQRVCRCFVAISTFLFALSWQFAQFILLLQAVTLFGLAFLEFIPVSKMRWLCGIHFVSLLLVCAAQFFHPMIPGSLVISFIPAAVLMLYIKGLQRSAEGFIGQCVRLVGHLLSVLLLTIAINVAIKSAIHVEADEHIFKFLMAKFGVAHTRDFDANLYLCTGAFDFLPMNTFSRLTHRLVFPFYGVAQVALLGLIVTFVWQKLQGSSEAVTSSVGSDGGKAANNQWRSHPLKERPELAFHCIQTVLFACIAVTTMRFKYLWTAEMCILAAFVVADYHTWKWLLKKCDVQSEVTIGIVRHAATLVVLIGLLIRVLPDVFAELEELREFYDPDTVALMNWIKGFTDKSAVFSGSMQLLAGVKLCTGRKLTNHPHYEDKLLREKTFQVYQYYGKRSAEDVYKIHKAIGTSYIILEDSICYSGQPPGCRLPDLIDIANGHVVEGLEDKEGLSTPPYGRFCDQIRQKDNSEYTKYFTPVFKNKTFRVYKLL